MNIQRRVLAVEAVVFSAPAIAFLGWGAKETAMLLWYFSTTPAPPSNEGMFTFFVGAPSLIIIGAFLLFVLGCLVVATLRHRAFRFGLLFWFAAVLSLLLGAYVYVVFNHNLALVLFIPLYALCGHAMFIQSRSIEPQQVVPADHFASASLRHNGG